MGMADRIKERRLAMNYTQEELAQKLELQKSAIAKYENGRVENIKRSVIARMANILECSPAYLMGWDEYKPEPDLIFTLPDGSKIILECMSPSNQRQTLQLLSNYTLLNSIGQKKAIDNIEDLTKIYSNKQQSAYDSPITGISKVAEEPAPYLVAAHNDHLEEDGEMEKVIRDLDKLKKPR